MNPNDVRTYCVRVEEGFTGVLRLASTLRQRGYLIIEFNARMEDADQWIVKCVLRDNGLGSLERRMHKLPCIIEVSEQRE